MSVSEELAVLLQRCESEQLHLSGQIQAFGALLRLDPTTAQVTHASANLASFVGIAADAVIGRPLASLTWLPAAALNGLPALPGAALVMEGIVTVGGERVDGRAIRSHDGIIVEMEKNEAVVERLPPRMLDRVVPSVPFGDKELGEQHQAIVDSVRDLTGYERVMVYRFHDDWSGEVIAEASDGSFGSYLGLRFPASDIPAVARDLYLINPCRMIPDAKAPAVPIIGVSGEPPDLTWSDLRSVSPVHLDYLDNMGVGASFSLPIRLGGSLWGLVACHSLAPRLLSPNRRAVCTALADAYSLILTSYFAGQKLQALDSLDRRVDGIMGALARVDDPLDGVRTMSEPLIDSMGAQGFAMAVGNDVVITGNGPRLQDMALIDDWFLNECRDFSVITDHLEDYFPGEILLLAGVRGMVAVKARSARSGWVRLYWFRPPQTQEVTWAGNPNKPVVERAGVAMLSPRRSFEAWIEVKSGYSLPWGGAERVTAAKFRSAILTWL